MCRENQSSHLNTPNLILLISHIMLVQDSRMTATHYEFLGCPPPLRSLVYCLNVLDLGHISSRSSAAVKAAAAS